VGTYGFLRGGLIAEAGKQPGEPLSSLEVRLPLPAAWRFVLIEPPAATGLHGTEEERAFELLPVDEQAAGNLMAELQARMLPALRADCFDDFAESVYRFGRLAGESFASVQGGPYGSQLRERVVQRLRRTGVRAVGQSSWGPTLFAITETSDEAWALVRILTDWPELAGARFRVTPASNQGAQVRVEED
jgi:predicted sugar kinase